MGQHDMKKLAAWVEGFCLRRAVVWRRRADFWKRRDA
jgi:hypothetical protein